MNPVDLFARAPVFHLAGQGPGGLVLRTLHGVVLDEHLVFHGRRTGAKASLVGSEVVARCDEVVAVLPSWAFHPQRACPATTWYRTAEARGVLRELEGPARARALQALMEKLQPEGRHLPVVEDAPLYSRVLEELLIAALPLDRVTGRDKRGQGKPTRTVEAALCALWERGAPGDLAAWRSIHAASPEAVPGAFRHEDVVLRPGGPDDAPAAAAAVADAYWNTRWSRDELMAAHGSSQAWVVGLAAGDLVATARAISDRSKHAWVYDVWVHPARRGQGLGRALLLRLLDHPAVRSAGLVHLVTRDAGPFYARLGFERVLARGEGEGYRETWTRTRICS